MNKEIEQIMKFLGSLNDNNNREWFAEHKKEYLQAKETFDNITNKMIALIGQFDDQVKGLEAKDCIYRIYRDTRFSHDKTPYKTHFGAYMGGKGGRKSPRGAYYLHFEANGGSVLAGGIWNPDTKLVKQVRQAIHDNIEEFTSIIEYPPFKTYFPELWGERLKTVPKPFSKELAHADLLKYKHYVIETNLTQELLESNNWEEQCIDIFKTMKPFNDFLNYTVDDFYSF